MILLGQKITYKEFIQRLKEKTDTIIPVSEYIGWGKTYDLSLFSFVGMNGKFRKQAGFIMGLDVRNAVTK